MASCSSFLMLSIPVALRRLCFSCSACNISALTNRITLCRLNIAVLTAFLHCVLTCLSVSCAAHVSFCRNDQTVALLAPPVYTAGFHCYFGAIRLLISRWVLSEISELQSPYHEWNGADQISRVCMHYLVSSPCPLDPGGTCVSLHNGFALLPATQRIVSAST